MIPHSREHKDEPLVIWKDDHNVSHCLIRTRVEHIFAKVKAWKVMRDCWLRGEGSAEAMAGIRPPSDLTLAG